MTGGIQVHRGYPAPRCGLHGYQVVGVDRGIDGDQQVVMSVTSEAPCACSRRLREAIIDAVAGQVRAVARVTPVCGGVADGAADDRQGRDSDSGARSFDVVHGRNSAAVAPCLAANRAGDAAGSRWQRSPPEPHPCCAQVPASPSSLKQSRDGEETILL